jgi:DNA replication protein DnaC
LPHRHLDKAQIARLGCCNYIKEAHNVIILGATGSGKTYLASAFGQAACRNFYPVRYVRLPELLGDLAIARGEGTYRQVIKPYKQVKLLILNEWLLSPLKEIEARDLWKSWKRGIERLPRSFVRRSRAGDGTTKTANPP